jgi:hypothetical protein
MLDWAGASVPLELGVRKFSVFLGFNVLNGCVRAVKKQKDSSCDGTEGNFVVSFPFAALAMVVRRMS